MDTYSCKSPVLFLVFNRLDVTARVFEAIRQVRPLRLYVASDGARAGRAGEADIVQQVREIATNVDWECEVSTLFRDENLGCGRAVSEAITWFFENEPEGIILEDDCLPVTNFFRFCDELLDRYRDNSNVHHIGGCNPLQQFGETNDYIYSIYNRIWGWATWRKSWELFDYEISFWPDLKKSDLIRSKFSVSVGRHFSGIFDRCYRKEIDTWDYQWFLSRLRHGYAIIPKINLVTNIGFGADATHTFSSKSPLNGMKCGNISFPLVPHGDEICPDESHDHAWGKRLIAGGVLRKLIRIIKGLFK